MTTSVHDLLDAIDRLPENDRDVLAAEVLRRTSNRNLPALRDEDFVSVAEEIFSRLDAREAADARP